MITFFHCTALFAALALSFSFICIEASPTPYPYVCSVLRSPPSNWSSEKAIFTYDGHGNHTRNLTYDDHGDHTRNLTLFKKSSLPLLDKDRVWSFTFTTTSSDEDEARAASVAFILLKFSEAAPPSSMQFIKLPLVCNVGRSGLLQLRHLCDPDHHQPLQSLPSSTSCVSESDPNDSRETTVSLAYVADAAELHVQAVHHDGESQINTAVTFPTNISQSDLDEPVSNEMTILFVGYITTSGEVTISVNNDESNHKKVVVGWVIVGVSMVGFFMGLLILVLFIRKRRGRIITSRQAGHAGAHLSAPTRAPFPYHDLESSPTPMMRGLPLSPPYKTDAFQISGTASWLKQPNAR